MLRLVCCGFQLRVGPWSSLHPRMECVPLRSPPVWCVLGQVLAKGRGRCQAGHGEAGPRQSDELAAHACACGHGCPFLPFLECRPVPRPQTPPSRCMPGDSGDPHPLVSLGSSARVLGSRERGLPRRGTRQPGRWDVLERRPKQSSRVSWPSPGLRPARAQPFPSPPRTCWNLPSQPAVGQGFPRPSSLMGSQ